MHEPEWILTYEEWDRLGWSVMDDPDYEENARKRRCMAQARKLVQFLDDWIEYVFSIPGIGSHPRACVDVEWWEQLKKEVGDET